MLVKTLVIYCLFACTFAWQAPERCAQGSRRRRSHLPASRGRDVRAVHDIGPIAERQHNTLIETYKNHQFVGVPIRAVDESTPVTNPDSLYVREFEIHAPYNCTFHTYPPRLLSSVACSGAGCKLSHTVATVDTYTNSEGYNWGVKISSKVSLFEKMFEVGGEVSGGKTYTCSYTKGRTTTDLVECSDPGKDSGQLHLYTVKSDMMCDFGGIKLEQDERGLYKKKYDFQRDPQNFFTSAEIRELKSSKQIYLKRRASFMLDMDKVSNRMYQKFVTVFPLFNPYTDLIYIDPSYMKVIYYKKTTAVPEYRQIVPFTNEGGDSVFQYACTKVPF